MSDTKSRVKVIQGPVGSGTSSACCIHIYQQAMAQPKQRDGKQRFRVYVLRETYAKLEETTVKTWLDWFPEKEFGRFYRSKPFVHEIRVGSLELDVIFVAMEDIADAAAFFKSLEPSLIWINEGQFTAYSIINEAVDRVSPPRYPAIKDGGCIGGGLILDTNAPPADHWIPIMRGDVPAPDWMTEEQKQSLVKPAGWRFFMQPPGLVEIFENKVLKGYRPNPDAENLKWLAPDFYMEKIGGKTKSWIDANIMNRSSVVVDGKPVYPDFRREVHVSDKPLEPIPGLPIIVGIDFGRQPAASCWQNLRGRWLLLREIIGRDMGANKFAPIVKSELATHFPGFKVNFWGDPTGGLASQSDDATPFKVFLAHQMMVRPAPGNNLNSIRKEAVETILCRTVEGKAAMLIDPRCITFITGMSGGYHFKRIQVSGERYSDEPNKNQYSHVCFVAGTPIATPHGDAPIERLRVGDVVETPLGPRRIAAAMTREATVRRYDLSTGQSLVCTPDHPFFTVNAGFIPVDAVEYAQLICSDEPIWKFLFKLRRLASPRSGLSSPSAGSVSTENRTAISKPTAALTYIVQFGRRITEAFRWDTLSIIGIPTPATTIRTTSNAWPPNSMPANTCRHTSGSRHQNEISKEPSSPLLHGADRIQNGRLRLARSPGRASLLTLLSSEKARSDAIDVMPNTKHIRICSSMAEAIARQPASVLRAVIEATITRIALASYAVVAFALTAMRSGRPVRVLAKSNFYRECVYNIEVEEAHAYYAAGVLVSNCESGEYAVLGGGEGRGVTMAGSSRPQPVNTIRKHNPFAHMGR